MAKGRAIKSNKEKRTIVSNKKKERDQFKKEMDMILLKNQIGEIIKKISDDKTKIENFNDKYKKNIEIINEKYADNSLYQRLFQNYIKNEYTLICISFVNKIVIDTKHNHLEQFEGKYNLNKIFNNLTKELLLNEYELILLSLYLEYIDISLYYNIFNLEEALLYLCFFIKKITLDNYELDPILYHLNKKYENFENNYKKWYKINEKKFIEKTGFQHKEINKRFREYNTPFNEYCCDNYIDYNYIVDRILTMSLPYVDIKKDNNNNKDNNTNDNINNNDYLNKNNINNENNTKEVINQINNNTNNNTNVINFVTNKNFEDNKDKQINPSFMKSELNINNNNKPNNNNIYKQLNQINGQLNMTPNYILHSLSNQTRINNKILVPNNNFNNYNENKIETNSRNMPLNNNIIINQLQAPSQSLLFNQQKPSTMDINNIFDKNNNSRLFENENDELRKILKNPDGIMRSSLSFDSQRNHYGMFLSNNNFEGIKNINYINNSFNNNDINKKQYNRNDVPFKPFNIICNKNKYINYITNPNIIYNNNYENNKPNNETPNIN